MRFILLFLALLVSLDATALANTSVGFLKHQEFIIVLAQWEKRSQDIDLWLKGPGEPKPVGYSNRYGNLFVLLKTQRSTFEMAYSKGVPDGTYSAVLDCNRCKKPVSVKLTVRIKSGGKIVSESKIKVKLRAKKRLGFRIEDQHLLGGIQAIRSQ